MKKTLALLMMGALVAPAFAADYANIDALLTEIDTQFTAAGYTAGDSFSISFTIDSLGYTTNSANILTLGSLGDLRIQAANGVTSAYVGIRRSGSEAWYDNSNYADPTATTWSGEHFTASYDADTMTNSLTFDAPTGLWMSMGANGEKTANGIGNQPITIAYDKDTNSTMFSVSVASGVTNVVVFQNAQLNVSDITRAYNDVQTSNLVLTPEPATATLSLLALAGLAARRKRH